MTEKPSQPTQSIWKLGGESKTPRRIILRGARPDHRRKLSRVWSYLAQELKRPSLLASSDSNDTDSTPRDPFDNANQDTREAARILGVGRSRSRSRSRRGTRENIRRNVSSTGVGSLADELEEKEDSGPVSIVVIDTEIPVEDEGGSSLVNGYGLTRQASGGSRTGSWVGGIAKSRTSVTEAMHGKVMSGVKAVWLMLYYFFNQGFAERHKERIYQKERYYGKRLISIAAATFYLVLWVLVLCMSPRPWAYYDKYATGGIYGFFSILTLPFVLFNVPYRAPWFWQIWLGLATWSLPDIALIGTMMCSHDYYNSFCQGNTMLESDFIIFASAIGQATISIFALGQHRVWGMIMMLQYFGLVGGFFFRSYTPTSFYRDSVYFLAYHIFLLIISFFIERSNRQLFELGEQLKLQYKATQRAQMAEKKASDLTKRFVSYIFHEVRVPLNTALLAVQNLEGEELFESYSSDQKEMVDGLTGSLSMMEKVLNDVLSFNRMETGTFTQAKAPFDLHKSIQLTALSHSSPAHMKGIKLEMELDPRIDSLDCLFIGDEMRLRQITSNLVSNSLKFTQNGSVKIVTSLLFPKMNPPELHRETANIDGDPEKGDAQIEVKRNFHRRAVVRIEVHDTGAGLRKKDVVDNRLFSPYVQTEMGRRQGGKGTGLGLALIRQIVQLSKGRLGVDSEYGKGSVFWLELPYLTQPRPGVQPSQSGSTDMSDLTVVDTTSTADTKRMNSAKSDPAPLPEMRQPPVAPLERMMTAEQFLVSGPSERDAAHTSRTPISRPTYNRTKSKLGSRASTLSRQTSRGSRAPALNNTMIRATSPIPPGLTSIDGRPSPRSQSPAPRFDSDKRQATSSPIALTPAVPLPEPWPKTTAATGSSLSPITATANDRRYSSSTIVRAGSPVPPPTAHDFAAVPTPSNADKIASSPLRPDDTVPLDVLVVDDDKLTRLMMARMLKRLGHRVETAENGQIALEKITDAFHLLEDAAPVDVVFLDNQMPLMTGVEVASRVRELGCPLFIVGCTGNALRQDQDEYIDAGADRILTKPIKQAGIEECVAEARRRLRGETVPQGFQNHDDDDDEDEDDVDEDEDEDKHEVGGHGPMI